MATARAVPSPISDADIKVRALMREFTRAFNASDFEAMKALYVNDAVVLPPHQRLAPGVTAICDLQRWLREAGESNLNIEVTRVIESTELVVALGTYTIHNRLPSGSTLMDRGKEFAVLQQQPNGEYRFLVQGWSSDLPPMPIAH